MTNRPTLLIWDKAWSDYAAVFASLLEPDWRVYSNAGENLDWLLTEVKKARAIVATRLPPEALPHAQNLDVFLCPGAGIIQNDPAALPWGCRMVNVYEHEAPIAEYVLMTMLVHATSLIGAMQSFSAGEWKASGRLGGEPHKEIKGRTVGIFGYGHIGREVAVRARAFGMRVAAISSRPERVREPMPDFLGGPDDLPQLLRISEFFVIAAPLTLETQGRIGASELRMLPRGAFLINVARAEIVSERALYEALASGHLGGAAIDVWYEYPAAGERGHGSRLPFSRLENVLCTPHYSAWTLPMILRRISRMTETLGKLTRGEELDRVVLVGTWCP